MSGSSKAVFLSYASQDAGIARQISEALRQAGVEVWFDQNALVGGDAWDRKIRQQIAECVLFIPIISPETQQRAEGYFRLEWHLAEQRSLLIAKGRAFIVPVTCDVVAKRTALVPDAFLSLQWSRFAADEVTMTGFVNHIRQLLEQSGIDGLAVGAPEPRAPDAGAPRLPDYELRRRIGRGSYGDVWLARGLTGVYRAIKIVWRDRFADAEPFEREFKGLKMFTSMSLPDAGQLALLHVGQNENEGFFYYVMELADDVDTGRDVNPASYAPLTLKEVRSRRGRLPASECVDFGIELARSLAALHGHGLVHRDIKPSNVILVGGLPKLADIGLVASADAALSYVGTEGYVPPEGPGSPAGDVFGLGKLLYELATGLDRQEFPRLPSQLSQQPDHAAMLQLNNIIIRACEPLPDQRYAHAGELLDDLLELKKGRRITARSSAMGWQPLAIFGLVVLLGAGGWFGWKKYSIARIDPRTISGTTNPPTIQAAAAPAKSIAVLPFENLSDDKENAFFADGVQEDILTGLANIKELKVISRTSVMQYRGTSKTIRQIGIELGVAYVLEGSVRRAGGKVRVTGQLIDARNEGHVWAQTFDGNLDDIFALQTRLATAIGGQLQAVLSPQERKVIATAPTTELAAYDFFLQARAIQTTSLLGDFADSDKVERLLQKAVTVDPTFVSAWVKLSYIHVWKYFNGFDRTPARLGLSRAAIDTAAKLAPDSGEIQRAMGYYFYYGFNDYPRATDHFRRALAILPNDSEVHLALGLVLRRQGKYGLAVEELRRAHELDPRNASNADLLAGTLYFGNRWDETATINKATLELDPENLNRAFNYWVAETERSNSMRPLQEWMAGLSPAIRQSAVYRDIRRDYAWEHGDAAEVIRMLDAGPSQTIESEAQANYIRAHALKVLGRIDLALPLLKRCRAALEKQWAVNPENDSIRYALCRACALLGDRTAALDPITARLDQLRGSGDLLNATVEENNRACVLALLGDTEKAIREISRLVRTPAGIDTFTLGTSIDWLSLHGDPGFEAIVRDPAVRAPRF